MRAEYTFSYHLGFVNKKPPKEKLLQIRKKSKKQVQKPPYIYKQTKKKPTMLVYALSTINTLKKRKYAKKEIFVLSI